MQNTLGAILILVSSVAVAGGPHGGGGGSHGASHAVAGVGSGAHATTAVAGRSSSAATATRISAVRPSALLAMRPAPLRPKPRPHPMLHAAYFPPPATVHPAGWYPIACTEEERREHRCPQEVPATRIRE